MIHYRCHKTFNQNTYKYSFKYKYEIINTKKKKLALRYFNNVF